MHYEQITSSGPPGAGLSVASRALRLLALTSTAITLSGGAAAGWGAVPVLADRAAPLAANAHAARTTSVREDVTATNVSHQGNSVINDHGRGTGTLSFTAVLQITVAYTKGTTRFVCSTSAGNVVAGGVINFFASGKTAVFTGTMAVTNGTGKYAHARGKLRVEGTMQRKTFFIKASVSGVISY
jgi:hypothetical protein